jgi:hypothetical protein
MPEPALERRVRQEFHAGPAAPEEWSGKRDSNPRPSAWKADALATELLPLASILPCPTRRAAWREGGGERRIRTSEALRRQIYSLLPLTARESPQIFRPEVLGAGLLRGAGEGMRTPDPLITNQLLYRLSYASLCEPVMLAKQTLKMQEVFSEKY